MTDALKMKLVASLAQGNVVSFRLPFPGGYSLCVERHMIEEAMDHWSTDHDAARRKRAMTSIERAMKRVYKRLRKNTATGKEMDELAADSALWLGHQLLFSDGERYLIANPKAEQLLQ